MKKNLVKMIGHAIFSLVCFPEPEVPFTSDTELKSRALMDRHVCEQKESIILRYEKHKQVCDQIISEQRRLITGKNPCSLPLLVDV